MRWEGEREGEGGTSASGGSMEVASERMGRRNMERAAMCIVRSMGGSGV